MKNMRNSDLLKATWMVEEMCNWGERRPSDSEAINELFCRLLDAANVKYTLATDENGEEKFVLV